MRATPIGQLLNSYLKQDLNLTKETAHLLFSANRWEAKYYIDDLLDQGITVIADRYSYSGIAYSMASDLDPEWCRSSEVGLPEPDLVIYFDVDIEQSYNDFVGSGGDVQERNDQVDFLAKVHNAYQCIPLMSVPWRFVDASGTKEATQEIVRELTIDAIRKTTRIRRYIHWSC